MQITDIKYYAMEYVVLAPLLYWYDKHPSFIGAGMNITDRGCMAFSQRVNLR